VGTERVEGQPGGFAQQRYVHRRRAWRRRFWWTFPLVAVVPVAVELPIALLTHAHNSGFWVGVGLGAGAAAAMLLFDSPPAHIERWRIGADGERATARQLRPLLRCGWTLLNDIETKHGNLDHVLVGPAGVFMLESKHLAGRLRIEAGKLVVRWHEDPEDGYENDSIGSRARGAAFDLHSRIDLPGQSAWVQAVVVLWADFDQRSIERDKVAWVRGDQLATVLAARPTKYQGDFLEQLTTATRKAVITLRQDEQLVQRASVSRHGQRGRPLVNGCDCED
jgi:Nuclease-related domain